MRKTTNQMPAVADEPGESRTQDLRIEELPAQDAATEQQDALRGGAVAERFTGIVADIFTVTLSDR